MKAPFPMLSGARGVRGFSLIELMVAMLLGLVVVGGAVSLMLASQKSSRTNEALSQVQESARTAFELMARDIRQAGVNGCTNNGRIANVLLTPSWWQGWFGLRGYDDATAAPSLVTGSGTNERVANTDALDIQAIDGAGLSVQNHDPVANTIQFNVAVGATPFTVGDILMVCDFDHATITRMTAYDSATVTGTFAVATGAGNNCSRGLGFPTDCLTAAGNVYVFARNSQIARFSAVRWFIGNNGRAAEGGMSLYRIRQGTTEEVVAGVTNMQIFYREAGNAAFVAAGGVGNWNNVNALSIQLTMDSADQRVSTDATANAGRLQRTFTNIVTLRNRVP